VCPNPLFTDKTLILKEIAEHLMDLKVGMEELKRSRTFKDIIRVLREIGNFLNSCNVNGFQLDYLSRVPEVKDTVNKHSLLQHLCSIILEKCKDTTDLHADIGGLSRCAKADWDEIARKIKKLETDCQNSWDNLRAIAKHDSSTFLRNKYESNLNFFFPKLLKSSTVRQAAQTTKIFFTTSSEYKLTFFFCCEKAAIDLTRPQSMTTNQNTIII
jgi:hypothetical protein